MNKNSLQLLAFNASLFTGIRLYPVEGKSNYIDSAFNLVPKNYANSINLPMMEEKSVNYAIKNGKSNKNYASQNHLFTLTGIQRKVLPLQ